MNLGENVWKRARGVSALGERAYLSAVSGFTVYGMVLASLVAYMTMDWRPGIFSFLLLGLGIPIVGIFIALKSSDWFTSFVGYNMVVIGMGAISGPSVSYYNSGVIMTALLATSGVTVAMSLIGIMHPRLLLSWGGYLFGALIALVLVRFGQAFMAGFGVSATLWDWPLIDYGAAVLFSLYIIYDWNRAMNIPRTLDNAVDSAVAIFLDVINLFWSFVRILGGGARRG